MFTRNQLTLLALAGTSIAAPALMEREAWRGPFGAWGSNGQNGGWQGWANGGDSLSTSTIWDITTDYVTLTGSPPAETTAAAATTTTTSEAAAETTVWTTETSADVPSITASVSSEAWAWTWTWTVTETPSSTAPTTTEAASTTTEAASTTTEAASTTTQAASTTATPTTEASSTTQWAAWTSTSSTSSASATATGSSWLDIANQWRSAGGLAEFTESSTLVANALKTAQDSGGQLVHELNPGTLAQVLAPGNADNFESVYVGGWLCEIPTLTGLDGICTTEAVGWDHSSGETGHAVILTSTTYTQIGCALAEGIWACDLC